jgi:hypothetical protein
MPTLRTPPDAQPSPDRPAARRKVATNLSPRADLARRAKALGAEADRPSNGTRRPPSTETLSWPSV